MTESRCADLHIVDRKGAVEGTLAPLAFQGRWRRYQELALEAFERDRLAGRRTTHVLAPPGSGKTVLGMEIVRRLGTRALVLCPNSAVQAQWLRTAGLFGAPDGLAAPSPDAPVACLTYQSLCQIQDPDTALGSAAERRWTADRARALGVPPAEVEQEAAAWQGTAARRRSREIARIKAAIKREIARGAHQGVELADLLEPAARRRVETLRRLGVRTLVLDECHHLASLWGYVVRTVAALLGEVHLVGLTATPPDELTVEEAELYQGLLGPVDFTIPTPAVVREGFLAPYQELAWLTEPLTSEAAWLAEHDQRFRQLVTDLHQQEAGGSLSFPEWVVTRLRVRRTAEGEPEVPWTSFQRRHPPLPWRDSGSSPRPACRCPRAPRGAKATGSHRPWTTGWSCLRTTRCAASPPIPHRPRPSATRRSRRRCGTSATG